MEATMCDSTRLRKAWEAVDPMDERFLRLIDPNQMKHDHFCRDFCAPALQLPGEACDWLPIPTPRPKPDCPEGCGCQLQTGKRSRGRSLLLSRSTGANITIGVNRTGSA